MAGKSAKKSAWRMALQAYRGHWSQCMGFILVQFALRLMVLTPLLFLLANGEGERWLRWLVWLCVPAFVFIVLPARQSAAFAMKRLLTGEGRLFAPDLLCCGGGYWQRLRNGLISLPLMLAWCAPLIAGFVYAVRTMNGNQAGESDGLTQINNLIRLGNGDPVRGALYVAAVFLLMVLCAMAGFAFHSAARHERAWGRKAVVAFRSRMGTVGVWFAGLALFVPYAVVLAYLFYHYARNPDIMTFAADMLAMLNRGQLPLPGKHALAALAATAVLLLPLIPLKSLLTAARVAILHGNAGEALQ